MELKLIVSVLIVFVCALILIRIVPYIVPFIIWLFRFIVFSVKNYALGFYNVIWLGIIFASKYARWWQLIIYFLLIPIVVCLPPLCVFLGYLLSKIKADRNYILGVFASGNVIAEGVKGSGKDLLFSFVSSFCPHYSNIQYHENTEIRQISDFNCDPNTYDNLISGDYIRCEKINKECHDYFISDGGICLPCHMDMALKKKYPSFPVYYALVRHLANSSIHINAQSYSRIWKPLREQAESFFHCNYTRVKSIFGVKIIKTEMVYYSKLKGIEAQVLPIRVGLFASDEVKALAAEQFSRYGEVRLLTLYQIPSRKSYDSRIFHEYLYGEKSPTSNPAEVF